MCDYSLHGIANRLAEEGETLVVHRFYTGSKGLTSPEYLKPTRPKGLMAVLKRVFAPAQSRVCAVCIPDGAKLMLHDISPAPQEAHDLCTTEAVTFRQLSANAGTYRDAVEFKNGVKVRLQDLEEGQRVKVLALSSEKVGVREEVHSRLRQVWNTESPDMHDGSFAISEELGDFYSDGGPEMPSSIQRGFGR
jgi:hypothetical protein